MASSENYDRIRATVESIPFLSLRKLVVLSNSGANKDLLERYEDLLGAVAESTDLLIIERKLDKRTGYYKYLKKHTDYKEFSELSEQELIKWLVERAKNQGASISQEAARYLQERVGSNQILLANELDKLVSYDSNITKESIDLLCEPTPNTTIFSLLEAAFSGTNNELLRSIRSSVFAQSRATADYSHDCLAAARTNGCSPCEKRRSYDDSQGSKTKSLCSSKDQGAGKQIHSLRNQTNDRIYPKNRHRHKD